MFSTNIFESFRKLQLKQKNKKSIKIMYNLYNASKTQNKNKLIDFLFLKHMSDTVGLPFTILNVYLTTLFVNKTFLVNNFQFKKNNFVKNSGFLIVNAGKSVQTYIKNKIVILSNTQIFLNNSKNNIVTFSKGIVNAPKLASSSIYKYISIVNSENVEFQFLRKNKVYNKGRYSRCRQNYRTGVYMCMYLSVVCIFGLYYWFFKFSFNFTYLWWFFIFFVSSFFLPKIIKYRLYEPSTILQKTIDLFKWLSILVKSILS